MEKDIEVILEKSQVQKREEKQEIRISVPQTKYMPLKDPDLSKLNAGELSSIDDVLSKLADMNASQISKYSHNDVPWMTTEEGDVIDYESVFYRTTPFQVISTYICFIT